MIATRSVLIQSTPAYQRFKALADRLKGEWNRPNYSSMPLEKLYELRETAHIVIPQYSKDSKSLPEAQERLACIEQEIANKETERTQAAVLDELF